MNNSLEKIIFLEFKNLKDFHSRNNNPYMNFGVFLFYRTNFKRFSPKIFTSTND